MTLNGHNAKPRYQSMGIFSIMKYAILPIDKESIIAEEGWSLLSNPYFRRIMMC